MTSDPNREQPELMWLFGTSLIYGGAGLFALVVLDQTNALPFRLPDVAGSVFSAPRCRSGG